MSTCHPQRSGPLDPRVGTNGLVQIASGMDTFEPALMTEATVHAMRNAKCPTVQIFRTDSRRHAMM